MSLYKSSASKWSLPDACIAGMLRTIPSGFKKHLILSALVKGLGNVYSEVCNFSISENFSSLYEVIGSEGKKAFSKNTFSNSALTVYKSFRVINSNDVRSILRAYKSVVGN